MKHVIWSDVDLNLEDWREDLQSEHPDYSDDDLCQLMLETNALSDQAK